MKVAPPDRYSRHRAIAGFSQERLLAMRVAVFGAGAIGNEVVKNFCLLGIGSIDLYDFDTVELHNLTRSILLR
ncbi:MAG: ThiF family adenylyltransferase, partial [Candidatus Methylophosphatis roskildensis]